MLRTWSLLRDFRTIARSDTYNAACVALVKTPLQLELLINELENSLSTKLFHTDASDRPGLLQYSPSSSLILTSQGMKWFIIVSELLRRDGDPNDALFYNENTYPVYREFEQLLHGITNHLDHEKARNRDDYLFFLISIKFLQGDGTMKTFNILTTDSFAKYLISPILAEVVFKYPNTTFSIEDATIDRETECDMYLLAYEHSFKDFMTVSLTESKLCLYASSSYLELMGVPKTLEDIVVHNVIRVSRSDVLLKFGKCAYTPIFYKKNAIMTDTLTSLIALGESSAGIICYAEHLQKYTDVKLEKIPEIGEENKYVKYTLGFHERHKNEPIVNHFRCSLKEALQVH